MAAGNHSAGCTPIMVIMPAYNAEKTLERSVRSVLEQTWPNVRLLIVDDGSSDSTPQILRRLSEEDGRLSYLTTANQGPAKARNTGLDALQASGMDEGFLTFMDADDELLPDALSCAMEVAGSAELILFGFTIVEQDGRERHYYEEDALLDRDTMKTAFPRLYKANLLNQVWGKLFSVPLLFKSGIRFQDYLWGEDRLFVFDFMEQTEYIAVCSACKYRYIMYPGDSLISRFFPGKIDACIEADRRARELSARYDAGDSADLRYMFAKSVFSCITTLFSPGCTLTRQEKLATVREICSKPEIIERCRDTAGGAAPNVLCAVLRTGNAPLILETFHAVADVSTRLPDVVMRIKHRK